MSKTIIAGEYFFNSDIQSLQYNSKVLQTEFIFTGKDWFKSFYKSNKLIGGKQ